MIKTIAPIDTTQLLKEYYSLEAAIHWTDYGHKGKQAGLQYRENQDPWASAVGKQEADEHDYTILNPVLRGTIFEKLIVDYNMFRTRLMWVGPYACYSMHQDSAPRIHIPIITNPECYFVFKHRLPHHLPEGFAYWVDTTMYHTFINCSDKARLHLVGVIV